MTLPIWITATGNIGSIEEGNFFSTQIEFTNPLIGTIVLEVVSGELPPGTSISQTGEIIGTIENIESIKTYNFVVRITNSTGPIERSFNIEVTDILPVWSDPGLLGEYVHYSIFEYQLNIIDPGFQLKEFKKVSGELPQGVQIDKSGLIYGLIDLHTIDKEYNFGVKADLDNGKALEKDFIINVATVGNRIPLWNIPPGIIGSSNFGEDFNFQFSAGDPDLNSITYSGIGLPLGLSINSSGYLSGTFGVTVQQLVSFTIQVSDGIGTSSRTFSINANNKVEFPITWVSEPGLLGQIKEGESSIFSVKASTSAKWIRYEVESGVLPDGLSLDPSSGQIWGKANEQVLTDTEFTFTIKAYNSGTSIFQEYKILLINSMENGAVRTSLMLFGDNNEKWYNLYSSNGLDHSTLYQEGNSEFGIVNKPTILLVNNLNPTTANDVYNTLKDTEKTGLVLGEVRTAKAFYNNEVIYEVLYRRVVDDGEGSLEQFIEPNNSTQVNPGSLLNYRNKLIREIGISGDTEILPLWMSSEQIKDDSNSIIGWLPSLVFAYVLPGYGQETADRINANSTDNEILYNRRVLIDRVIIDPLADNSFEKTTIIF